MSLILRKCKSDKDWDKLVENSLQGNFFCTSFFLKLTNNDKNLYLVEDGENILAGIIVNENLNNSKNIPFFYQGIILNNKFLSEKNHKLSKKYIEITAFLIEKIVSIHDSFNLSLDPSLEDIRPFQWFRYNDKEKKKFSIEIKYTGLLDLSNFNNFQEYIKSIRSVRRQEYNRIKEGLSIEEEQNIKNLNILHEKTFERQNLKRGTEEKIIITDVISNLVKKNIGKLLSFKDLKESKIIASSYFLIYKNNAYNLTLATDPVQRKISPGTSLLLKQIELCFKNKLKCIDFVGINSPNRGDYKLSFNAKPKIYFNLKY